MDLLEYCVGYCSCSVIGPDQVLWVLVTGFAGWIFWVKRMEYVLLMQPAHAIFHVAWMSVVLQVTYNTEQFLIVMNCSYS